MSADLNAIKARWAAATPGPWEAGDTWVYTMPVYPDDNRLSSVLGMKFEDPERREHEHARAQANAEAIAHAPEDIAALLDLVERQHQQFLEMNEVINDQQERIEDFNHEIVNCRVLEYKAALEEVREALKQPHPISAHGRVKAVLERRMGADWLNGRGESERLASACKCGDCFHPVIGPNTDGASCDWCQDCACPITDHTRMTYVKESPC